MLHTLTVMLPCPYAAPLAPLVQPDTRQRICFLNTSPEEVIRSLFYNKNNDSLISVSVYAADNFSSLKCRTTPLEYATPLPLLWCSPLPVSLCPDTQPGISFPTLLSFVRSLPGRTACSSGLCRTSRLDPLPYCPVGTSGEESPTLASLSLSPSPSDGLASWSLMMSTEKC